MGVQDIGCKIPIDGKPAKGNTNQQKTQKPSIIKVYRLQKQIMEAIGFTNLTKNKHDQECINRQQQQVVFQVSQAQLKRQRSEDPL